ncbi:transcriptional regulator [Chelatococcus daeguensis]|uniref:Transcriptional regulator n=1 Tax=Chelatococcus daeguensis TaxID=444444 RepID=A0AAC9NXM2_9HYPH|nr:helix-turn-helix transcriptional regulator [Chelatococcus daeguensis]APF36203.1 transcriptional regulator [Chelatococcus daeguensis]
MVSTAAFAEIATLAGEPARAAMLQALMDGRAMTAGELARAGGVTPQTASGHLARLTEAGLVAVEKQGRHRYHRLASRAVAQMMEGIMQVAATRAVPGHRLTVGPRDAALRRARTCYDHLAGRLGVALADMLVEAGHAEIEPEAATLMPSGADLLASLGIDLAGRTAGRRARVLCRPCLDWSERRPHLAGAVGAALCSHCFAEGWIRRIEGSRAVAVTRKGEEALRRHFGIVVT